jgi:hypothetical protein
MAWKPYWIDEIEREHTYNAIIYRDGDYTVARIPERRLEYKDIDASVVIENAINSLSPYGGIVFFKGQFLLNRTVDVNVQYVSLVGMDKNTVLSPNFDNAPMFRFNDQWLNSRIANLYFNAMYRTGVTCLLFNKMVSVCDIVDSKISTVENTDAIRINNSDQGGWELTLSRNTIDGNVYIYSENEITMIHNKFGRGTLILGYGGWATIVGCGFENYKIYNNFHPYMRILGCWWSQHTKDYAIYIEGAGDGYPSVIEGNIFRLDTTNTGHAIRFSAYSYDCMKHMVRNNVFVGGSSTSRAIYGYAQTGYYIKDNIIEANDLRLWNGIKVSGIDPTLNRLKANLGYVTENSGKATFSGDGTKTQFTIAHGLDSTPNKVLVTPGSGDAKGNFYVTVDATYIYVNYATAPPAGTNNVVLYWYAEV